MRSFRSKPVGWRYESHRHYLAAKGIKTRYNAQRGVIPDFGGQNEKEKLENYRVAMGVTKSSLKKLSDLDKKNKEYFDEVAEVGTDSNEIREISKDMEDDYVALGMSKENARKQVKDVLKRSKAFEPAVMTSDEPDELLFAKKDVSVERLHDGSLLLSDIVNGHLVKQRYTWYDEDVARLKFKKHVAELAKKEKELEEVRKGDVGNRYDAKKSRGRE